MLLVGQPGAGKTALVEGLARLSVSEELPEPLRGLEIFKLTPGELQAGTGLVGSLEERVRELFRHLERRRNAVLFIDEIHVLAQHDHGRPSNNLLKPYLDRSGVRVIGATTTEEVAAIHSDPALSRRFHNIHIQALSHSQLQDALKKRAAAFGFELNGDACERMLACAETLHSVGRAKSEAAFDLIDQSVARAKLGPQQEVGNNLITYEMARPAMLSNLQLDENVDYSITEVRQRADRSLQQALHQVSQVLNTESQPPVVIESPDAAGLAATVADVLGQATPLILDLAYPPAALLDAAGGDADGLYREPLYQLLTAPARPVLVKNVAPHERTHNPLWQQVEAGVLRDRAGVQLPLLFAFAEIPENRSVGFI